MGTIIDRLLSIAPDERIFGMSKGQFVLDLFLLILLLLSYLIYKARRDKNLQNPEYQRKLAERRAEALAEQERLAREDQDLEEIMNSDYSDSDGYDDDESY